MNDGTYDFVIIGGGTAAFAGAIKASDFGEKVAMIERGTIGGTCVNTGCLPSKNMLHTGEVYFYGDHTHEGIKLTQGSFRLSSVIKAKDQVVLDQRTKKYSDVLDGLEDTTFIQGTAKFVSPNEVKVNGKRITGRHFLIATGSSPRVPPVRGIDKVDYLTNVEMLDLKRRPKSLLVIGGRALGLEFAQMYAHYGADVTLLQRSERILPKGEPEISEGLRSYLEEEGIKIHTGAQITQARQKGEKKIVDAKIGDNFEQFEADVLLLATGRTPNTRALALEEIGVKLKKDGAVSVDDQMRTSISNIWAAGDVIGEPMLESAAAKEGAVAARNALKGARKTIDFNTIPRAVFTSPQVASVGLTDAQALQDGIKCQCGIVPISLLPKAVAIGKTRGVIKLVVETKSKRVVGCHILAEGAADIIHEAVFAVKFKLTVDDIIDTVHVFPTMSDAVKYAAISYYRDVSKITCCVE